MEPPGCLLFGEGYIYLITVMAGKYLGIFGSGKLCPVRLRFHGSLLF